MKQELRSVDVFKICSTLCLEVKSVKKYFALVYTNEGNIKIAGHGNPRWFSYALREDVGK